jgi:hypothetical protein
MTCPPLQVPPYYFNPYCPFGLRKGYCIEGEACPFPDITCGITKSRGWTAYGDVWLARIHRYKVPCGPFSKVISLDAGVIEASGGMAGDYSALDGLTATPPDALGGQPDAV